MTQASRKQKESKPIADHVMTNVREVLVFASIVIGLFLFLALLTYHPDDPGWSHSVSANEFHNSVGAVGAWIADIILYVFGYFGYLFPIMIFVSGWRLFQSRRKQEPFNQLLLSIRTVGIVFGLIGGCGVAWMHFSAGNALPYEVRGAGGILGDAIGSILLNTTGEIGSTLLMLAMLMIGLTLYTGLSWVVVMDSTGRFTLNSITVFRNRLASFKDEAEGRRVKKDREHLFKQEQEIVEQTHAA